ncbi:hypothetical protein LCGC14_2156390 [marine sediment metagenome]|uniref:Uncharacterized protein n=1 Tax=marine sediment metagenome TaxID=412755 RepID=A0A0F9G743_9ZZZZ
MTQTNENKMDILDLFKDHDCKDLKCVWHEIATTYIKCQNPYCKKTFKIQVK